tara:strand:- start:9733 stop:10050 length:318 start_codon:yes stop_codon:yes gene_type:complete
MTVTASPKVKDLKISSSGFVESASVNSITDFIPSNLNESKVATKNDTNDFVNLFICHLIFYIVFCISLVLHILIDLGLGTFLKNKFEQLIFNSKEIVFDKRHAFA